MPIDLLLENAVMLVISPVPWPAGLAVVQFIGIAVIVIKRFR